MPYQKEISMELFRQTDLPTDYLISRATSKQSIGFCHGKDFPGARIPAGLALNELGVILHTTDSDVEKDEAEKVLREVLSDTGQFMGNRATAFFYFKLPGASVSKETEQVVKDFENDPENAYAVDQVVEAVRLIEK